MRVTDRLIFEGGAATLGRVREQALSAQQAASTGLRVEHPGDDPVAAGLVTGQIMAQQRFNAMADSAGRASDELSSVDGALGSIATWLARAQELAVQFSNSTYDAGQRAAGAAEVTGIINDVVAQLNLRVGNRYVFGGNRDDAPPFDVTGNYAGDDGVRQVEVAPGVLQAASVRADVAVKGAAGGVDVLATLQALQTALASDDPAGVADTLPTLGDSVKQIGTARSEAGTAMNAFDAAVTASKLAGSDAQKQISKLTEVDEIDAATQLALAQRSLEASLAATAQGFKLSLLDYLR